MIAGAGIGLTGVDQHGTGLAGSTDEAITAEVNTVAGTTEVVKVPAQTAARKTPAPDQAYPRARPATMPAAWNPVPSHHPGSVAKKKPSPPLIRRETGASCSDTMAPGEPFNDASDSRAGLEAARAAWDIGWRSKVCRCWMRINSPERPSHPVARPRPA